MSIDQENIKGFCSGFVRIHQYVQWIICVIAKVCWYKNYAYIDIDDNAYLKVKYLYASLKVMRLF